MDDSIYSIVLLLIICAAIYLVITGRSSHTSKRIGETGEFNIISIIERCLRKGLYGYVLHNLYVPKVDGGSSEVKARTMQVGFSVMMSINIGL